MLRYIAIFEDVGPDHAVGVAVPDLPGCFSAGDTFEEAYQNVFEAIGLWLDDPDLKEPPKPRTLRELRADPAFNESLVDYSDRYVLVVIPYEPNKFPLAAE
jgi:predicted RNase H-like HicB family nuclease